MMMWLKSALVLVVFLALMGLTFMAANGAPW